MLKLAHIYSLLILWSLLRLAERQDQIKPDDRKAEHLLQRIRNSVQLTVAKLRAIYSSYDLMNFNGSLGVNLNEFEKLKKELKSFLLKLDSKRHEIFNHKYRLLLAQINVLIDEIPRFEIETFDNSSFYQRISFCFLSICNSLCRFFSNLECSVSKLEEYNRKIDRLQMIAKEFRYLSERRRQAKKKGRRRLVKRRDQFRSPETDDLRRRRRDQFRPSEREFRGRRDPFRRPNEDDLRRGRTQLRPSERDLRWRRDFHSSEHDFESRDQFDLSENKFRRKARKDENFVRTKKSRQKAERPPISPFHRLVNLVSYRYLMYGQLVDRLFSTTQDYWDTLMNKLNDFFTV